MTIGSLRKQVSVQAEVLGADSAGGYTPAWTTRATVWAEIEPLSGREVLAAQHLEGRVTHRVTMRWRDDLTITPAQRLLIAGRAFNIRSVLNRGERNQWLDILAEEGGAA